MKLEDDLPIDEMEELIRRMKMMEEENL